MHGQITLHDLAMVTIKLQSYAIQCQLIDYRHGIIAVIEKITGYIVFIDRFNQGISTGIGATLAGIAQVLNISGTGIPPRKRRRWNPGHDMHTRAIHAFRIPKRQINAFPEFVFAPRYRSQAALAGFQVTWRAIKQYLFKPVFL